MVFPYLVIFILALYVRIGISQVYDTQSFIAYSFVKSFCDAGLKATSAEDGAALLEKCNDVFSNSRIKFFLAKFYFSLKNYNKSISLLSSSIEDNPSCLECYQYLAHSFRNMNANTEAIDAIANGLTYFPDDDSLFYLLGLSYQSLGLVDPAGLSYAKCLSLNPDNMEARINLGTLHQQYGNISIALDHYLTGKRMIEHSFNSSMHRMSDKYAMLVYDATTAQYQLFQYKQGMSGIEDFLKVLSNQWSLFCNSDMNDSYCRYLTSQKYQFLSLLLLFSIKSFFWKNYETILTSLFKALSTELRHHPTGVLLPFDSLLFPLSLSQRRFVAEIYCSFHEQRDSTLYLSAEDFRQQYYEDYFAVPNATSTLSSNSKRSARLRLGLLSYDFNDHPTAHMMEALLFDLTFHSKSNHPSSTFSTDRHDTHKSNIIDYSILQDVDLFVYHYGLNDSSYYYNQFRQLAPAYRDLSNLPTATSVDLIRQDHLDIVLDLQVHTLGNHFAWMAQGLAPYQINYLVFPGTSGSRSLDHIVVDSVVVPPEQAIHFTEALIVLPSYQLSYYSTSLVLENRALQLDSMNNGLSTWSFRLQLRQQVFGKFITSSSIVFCNFNKIDKIDLMSFQNWMNILSKYSDSYLWLLIPISPKGTSFSKSEDIEEYLQLTQSNIRHMAHFYGIASHRIVFAERVSKVLHIQRLWLADAFIDSFVYGAHSTATDALRSGLPFFSVKGDSFPSRVGASVLESLDSSCQYPVSLVSSFDSMKSLENHLPRLIWNAKKSDIQVYWSPWLLRFNEWIYDAIIHSCGVFNHQKLSQELIHGLLTLLDSGIVNKQCHKKLRYHIIVPPQ